MLKQQESEPEADGNNAPDDFIQQIIHVIEANLANENFNVKNVGGAIEYESAYSL